MIRVVNFPFCNFYSLQRYLSTRKYKYEVLSNQLSIISAEDLIILPGVGSFGDGMSYLVENSLDVVIKNHVNSGGNVLGICLGMQLLFSSSEESPNIKGLSLICGTVNKIKPHPSFRIPHIGWNEIVFSTGINKLPPFEVDHNGRSVADFYFVHSYVVSPANTELVTAYFDHPHGPLPAACALGSVKGIQFHPEKSGTDGYLLLDNYLAETNCL